MQIKQFIFVSLLTLQKIKQDALFQGGFVGFCDWNNLESSRRSLMFNA